MIVSEVVASSELTIENSIIFTMEDCAIRINSKGGDTVYIHVMDKPEVILHEGCWYIGSRINYDSPQVKLRDITCAYQRPYTTKEEAELALMYKLMGV